MVIGGEELVEAPAPGGRVDLLEAAHELLADDDLGERHHARAAGSSMRPAGSLARLISSNSRPREANRPFTRAQKEHG